MPQGWVNGAVEAEGTANCKVLRPEESRCSLPNPALPGAPIEERLREDRQTPTMLAQEFMLLVVGSPLGALNWNGSTHL